MAVRFAVLVVFAKCVERARLVELSHYSVHVRFVGLNNSILGRFGSFQIVRVEVGEDVEQIILAVVEKKIDSM